MRFVREQVVAPGVGRLRSGSGGVDVKAYLERIAKYIPAEVVAAYISASGAAPLARAPGFLVTLIFVVCLVCTPLYVTRFTTTKKESVVNSTMALLAFVVWAYATGVGLFQYLGWYDAPTASVLLALFTLASGAVVPVSKRAVPKPTINSEIPA